MMNNCDSSVSVCDWLVANCDEFMWKVGEPDFDAVSEVSNEALHYECYQNREALRKSKEDFLIY